MIAAAGAHARGVQSSANKALTFMAPTSQLAESIKTDRALGQKIAANPAFAPRSGGVLLQSCDVVIGAIGVGGARGGENDAACALAGIEKIQPRLK